MYVYRLRFARGVERDLRRIRGYQRAAVVAAIERHLVEQPSVPARSRKMLITLIPPWAAARPVWELRVGDVRVFYDVDENERLVYVRAVRRKPAGKITEEIL